MVIENLFTIAQIAALLHRSRDSTRRLVKEKMGFIYDGKQMLVKESSLAKYLDEHCIKARPTKRRDESNGYTVDLGMIYKTKEEVIKAIIEQLNRKEIKYGRVLKALTETEI